jgi:hypothetical protein
VPARGAHMARDLRRDGRTAVLQRLCFDGPMSGREPDPATGLGSGPVSTARVEPIACGPLDQDGQRGPPWSRPAVHTAARRGGRCHSTGASGGTGPAAARAPSAERAPFAVRLRNGPCRVRRTGREVDPISPRYASRAERGTTPDEFDKGPRIHPGVLFDAFRPILRNPPRTSRNSSAAAIPRGAWKALSRLGATFSGHSSVRIWQTRGDRCRLSTPMRRPPELTGGNPDSRGVRPK